MMHVCIIYDIKDTMLKIYNQLNYSYDKVEGELGGRGELGGQQEGCREGEKQQS